MGLDHRAYYVEVMNLNPAGLRVRGMQTIQDREPIVRCISIFLSLTEPPCCQAGRRGPVCGREQKLSVCNTFYMCNTRSVSSNAEGREHFFGADY